MFGGRTKLRRALALLALVGGGAAAALAATPVTRGWTADPDEQFLLDVKIRQLRLGEGVRAYQTPDGPCVLFGDFLTTLDVPVKIDLQAKTASGWAFKEANRVKIDLAARTATYRDRSEPLAEGVVRETPEGWCVQADALGRWFGIGVKPMTSGSVLLLESEAKLPVELAMEREQRAANLLRKAKFDIATLPQVKLPYRMWRAPALDFVVSAGMTYRAGDGVKVDRRSSVYAAGEIARLSYDAQMSTDARGKPGLLRFRAYRSDPDGGLLGPLKATHFGLGDVAGLESRLTGSNASGRGAMVTNRPLFSPSSFGRTRFEGDLPTGWEAEIYRNGELLGFARPSSSQRYVFDDVELLYGENRVSIVLYGPQGQIRTRDELVNVGRENVPAGKTWYWAGFNQPGRDLLSFAGRDGDPTQPAAQATVGVEHGVDDRLSVGVMARAMLVEDRRVTFVEGTVRRAIGPALAELSVGYDGSGGKAVSAEVLAKVGAVNIRAEATAAKDFHLHGGRETSRRDARIAVDAPVKLGRTTLPAHAYVRVSEQRNGTSQLEAAARLAGSFQRFNLASEIHLQKQYLRSGPAPPNQVDWSLIGSGRVGDVRLRGSTMFEVSPEKRFRAAELSAYWSASDRADWEGGLAYDALAKRANARVTHIRRLDSMAIALTGEAATDGSVALGVNLNFSLDPAHRFRFSRQPLAAAGVIHARVYRDLNDNGARDAGEPLERGALVTTGTRLSEKKTDERGAVLIGGLPAFTPVTVGIDPTSLSDPMLVPKKAMQVVVPRPGVPADVEIGLVGGGDIEGALVKSGGLGFEGLDLELVDATGKVVATARTDFDGFFLFERVAYGEYRIRLAASSAEAAGVLAELGVSASVSADKSVARLGAVPVRPQPQIASSE